MASDPIEERLKETTLLIRVRHYSGGPLARLIAEVPQKNYFEDVEIVHVGLETEEVAVLRQRVAEVEKERAALLVAVNGANHACRWGDKRVAARILDEALCAHEVKDGE